jgi:hypothetical protein
LHEIEDGGQVREHDPVLLGHDLAFGLLDLGLGIGIHEPCLGLDEIGLRLGLFNLKSLSDSTRHSSAVLSSAVFFGFVCFFPLVAMAGFEYEDNDIKEVVEYHNTHRVIFSTGDFEYEDNDMFFVSPATATRAGARWSECTRSQGNEFIWM